MNTQQAQFTTYIIGETKGKNDDWKVTVKKYLFHWPLFLIALIFTLSVAFVYMKRFKPVYEIKATMIIKDNSKTPEAKSNVLDEIGLTGSSELIENEMKVLKSRQLISKIVDDFQLWTTYYRKDGLFTETDGLNARDVYTDSPVKFVLLKRTGDLENQGVKIKVIDDKSFTLVLGGGKSKQLLFADSYSDKFGTWKLVPNKNILDAKGKTVYIGITEPAIRTLEVQQSIEVSLSSKLGTSIDLAVSDVNEKRGKDILNAVIANYYETSTTEKNRELKQTLEFLDQRLASLTGELSTAERGIEGFRTSKGLTDISSQTKISLENLQANDSKLNEVNLQLSVINGIDQYVNSSQNMGKIPSTIGIDDPSLLSSIEKLSNLQLDHDRLAANMPETNPEFEPINRQIRTTKSSIRESVKNIKNNLQNSRNKLQAYNNRFEASIRDIPSEERQFVNIKRQQSSKENTYTYLLQKREEVAVKYASNLSNNRIVDDAYAETPKDPKALVYFVSIFMGLALPISLVYGRGALSDKIIDADDITNAVDIPIVGELPYDKKTSHIAIKDNSLNAISEQLRALRIKLYYLHDKKETGRVTLVTSSISKEGKSFVSVNISSALAMAFKKTIILELDMRKPKVAQYFGVTDQHKGMSEYLLGKATLPEIIRNSGANANLDIISCGQLVDNPSELLEQKRLAQLIDTLKEQYDDIVIDSPPAHLVPDAILLSRLCGVTLYIVRQGYTEKSEMKFLKQLQDQDHMKNINIVFNSIERVKYGYGYKYDESYYTNTKAGFLQPIFSDFRSRF
ncbi:GumC family protein [Pedobacter endophyticus]|uniref:non-specific protein-tyrosine kinase n=1 Tax=Pedobacter endophyticus TaxID=2789740 RepID=A0A7S9KZW8_9SPHI|nr:tyrosine-protein kinase family protein [Pedobacter endophyticus]QPH39931.1 polysaccharide biosynthesis tyrosine autokinase [Pedobacter endophyticus]